MDSNWQDLYLCLMNSVSYTEEFSTDQELKEFKEFIKKKKGSTKYRLYSEFGGKTTHPASSISLQFFEPEFCKRLTKTVGPTLWNFHILYPFFSF